MKTYEITARFTVKFDQDLTKLEAANEVQTMLEGPPLVAYTHECKVTRDLSCIPGANAIESSQLKR